MYINTMIYPVVLLDSKIGLLETKVLVVQETIPPNTNSQVALLWGAILHDKLIRFEKLIKFAVSDPNQFLIMAGAQMDVEEKDLLPLLDNK
jgi:hypothetical protein